MTLTTVVATSPPAPVERALGLGVPAPEPRPRSRGRRTASAGFRSDIQGLRAVAVLAVVLSHAGLAGFDGGYVGVDVFFVISGFLITGHLLRELEATGTIGLRDFYARRARRLLPAAATVVLVSGFVTYVFESSLAARRLAVDTLWVAAYAMNIELASSGTDYFESEVAPSTLQHFWSLAVEEQFYVVWPVLVLLAGGAALGRRRTGGSRRRIATCLTLVLAASLTLSVWQTAVAQSWAYFGLHTRAWELAGGALVAVALPQLGRLPAAWGAPLAYAGLAAIVAAVATFDDTTAFPGYAAALPVGGAVLVVLGGSMGTSEGAGRLLGLPPFQAIGAVSYSWYLWHWPVLLLMPSVLGWAPTTLNNAFVVSVALLISVVGYTAVEVPVRAATSVASTPRGLLLGIGVTAVLATVAGAAFVTLPQAVGYGTPVIVSAVDTQTVRDSLALRAVPANLTPTIEDGADDVPTSRANGCHLELLEDTPRRPCDYGDLSGDKTMMLFGDSHADQWLPALDEVASETGYHLFARTKAACPAADLVVRDGDLGREYTECTSWRQAVMAEIAATPPDVVVLSSSYGIGNKSSGDWSRAMTSTVSALTERGITVVSIADTPRRADGVTGPDCVAAHLDDVSRCVDLQDQAFPFDKVSAAVQQSVQRSGGLTVDPTGWFCGEQRCPAVIGNYLVYRDQSHVTSSYIRFLAPELRRALGLA